MLVIMKSNATEEEIETVCRTIESMGYRAHPIPGSTRTAIGITGNQGPVEAAPLECLSGVLECIPVSKPYKLVLREVKEETTIIDLGDGICIGGDELAIIAGPCAIENYQQARTIAAAVLAAGAKLFRGGAYKPRTSPYSFQGLAEDGLKILEEVRQEFGLKIVTEAIDVENVDLVERYCDIIQIGARNMQNFSLLRRVGKSYRPVLLKRGISATLDELLMAAEYILSEGNYKVILCERGIRTFTDHTRNTLDLSVIPAVRRVSHLPIIVDPSHGTGRRENVLPLSRAAIAVGADGIMVEVHHQPEQALSDGFQSIRPSEFQKLMNEIRQIAKVVGRTLASPPENDSHKN